MTVVYDFEKYREEGVVEGYEIDDFDVREIREEDSLLDEDNEVLDEIREYINVEEINLDNLVGVDSQSGRYIIFNEDLEEFVFKERRELINELININPDIIVLMLDDERVESELVFIFGGNRVIRGFDEVYK